VLLSNRVNYWTGQEGRIFEHEFAAWCGAEHAIAVANGTVALDLALYGLGVGARNGGQADDEVIVAPRTFMASTSTVATAGAVPVFADVEQNSGNITADTISNAITPNTKAIIAVHLAGWPCDMDPIMKLAETKRIKVIEDCAQAHGARYKGRPVGAIGHVGAWSFCQDKIMTTGGEGGLVTTNHRDLWARMWAHKDHGKSWEAVYKRQHPPGFRWLHESFGTNWRMTEMQSAIGRIQLTHMSDWSTARTIKARTLNTALTPFAGASGPVRVPEFRCAGCLGCDAVKGCAHAYYKYYAYVRPGNLKLGWGRDRIIEEIVAQGVPCFQGSCSEVYLEKAFDGTGWRPKERLPVARELGETSLTFLVHPTLTDEEMSKTASAISRVLSKASK
jgi:dTDP-4-amino-4,6-dideoxygalactose transaminase